MILEKQLKCCQIINPFS